MRIAFVGGGTGGHFYPLIAVAEAVADANPDARLYYIGPEPYDMGTLLDHRIDYIYCPAGKMRRYFSIQNFIDAFRTFAGIFIAFFKLFSLYPDVIFSKGGYTSIPILIMARYYRIPVVIHESDSVPGRANKYAAKFARYIAISYDETAKLFTPNKTALTGIPIRKNVLNAPRNAHEILGIQPNIPLIYVTGGSQGAERINELILQVAKDLLPYYQIFHQTGEKNEAAVKTTAQALLDGDPNINRYYIAGKVPAETTGALITAASIVISRAGSTTLFEIAAHGKPAIIIPIPESISHDQRSNAYAYARTGAAAVLEEKNLTKHLLIEEINSIMSNVTKQQQMGAAAAAFVQPDAAKKIADILIAIGNEHGS